MSYVLTSETSSGDTQALGAAKEKKHGIRIREVKDFRRLWTGSALSMIAFRTLGVSYPLIALAITGSPAAAGWVGFAWTLPGVLFYIPAGALIGRFKPRSVMLCAEALRGISVISVFAALSLQSLSMTHLFTAAIVEGAMWALHSLAETTLIPSLVTRDQLPRALARSETSFHVAVMTGRPLGGLLLGLGQAVPFAVNTVLFALSFGSLLRMEDKGTRYRNSPNILSEIADGVRILSRHHFLYISMALTAITNLMINTLIMVFLTGSAGLSSFVVGSVLAMGGFGGLLGSFMALRMRPPAAMPFIQMWVWVIALLIAAAGQHPVFFGLATLTTGFFGALNNVTVRTFEADQIAPDKIARVASVSRLVTRGAIAAAAPAGGLLVAGFGIGRAAVILFVTMLAIAVIVTAAPPLRKSLGIASGPRDETRAVFREMLLRTSSPAPADPPPLSGGQEETVTALSSPGWPAPPPSLDRQPVP
nr:MFS transporter [Planobispora siamensis]